MIVMRGRAGDRASTIKSSTFSGTVWADSVLPTVDGTTINDVFFTPCARTYWHSHERGQLLFVTSGLGIVCPADQEPAALTPGDVVWVPAGERHWHGAAHNTYMLHRAVSLGATDWAEEVSESDYARAGEWLSETPDAAGRPK